MVKTRGLTHRILTGDWKGRAVRLPNSPTVRPTKAAVLEAGLNLLASRMDIRGSTALDVCCGSGQWGLELLSRGAAHVTFIDLDTTTVRENIAQFAPHPGRFQISQTNVPQFQPTSPAQLIVADPPYTAPNLLAFVLLQHSWLQPDGYLLLETATNTNIHPTGWVVATSRNYGKSKLTLLQPDAMPITMPVQNPTHADGVD